MTVDARGRVTGWSDGARRLTGYRADEVVGRAARELLARGALPGTLSGTAEIRHRDGGTVLLRLRSCPLLGADGVPLGHAVTAAPEGPGYGLIEEAVQQASPSMAVLDRELRFLHANDTACRMMGRPAEELIGRSLPETLARTGTGRGPSCTNCGSPPSAAGPSSTRATRRPPPAPARTPGPSRSGRSTTRPARSPPSPWPRWRAPSSIGRGSGWRC